ncbi:hypothetical protein [Actinacidiphila sp. bgisy160]|uniref:hypothetical protein n=1 Tax=Actinacidiphila sp. bgisy160 TaxID=3413796 RepID=UPI003D705DA2
MRRIEATATGQPSEHAAKASDATIPLGRHAAPEQIAAPCSISRATTGAPPPEPPSRSTVA